MAQFDIESFRDHFLTLIQNNLSAKVSAINTEKGDSLLVDIPNEQYLKSFNNTVMNFDKFIYYRITNIETVDAHAGGLSEEITLPFVAMFSKPDNWDDAEKMVLRYSRAFREIILDNARSEPAISDLEVSVYEPDMIQLSADSAWYQAGGIEIKGVITT